MNQILINYNFEILFENASKKRKIRIKKKKKLFLDIIYFRQFSLSNSMKCLISYVFS